MLNRYPLWKYIMVVLIIAVSALYALPNIYGEDPAVQVTGARGASVELSMLDTVTSALDKAHLSYKSAVLEKGSILVRFKDTDTQISARDVISNALGKNVIVALNLAASTPHWLESIGGAPMKLGLDLRGGVHFLMEVDMNAVWTNYFLRKKTRSGQNCVKRKFVIVQLKHQKTSLLILCCVMKSRQIRR